MSVQVLQPIGGQDGRLLVLVALLFGAFSYALLSIWGAIVAEDWSVVLSERRVVLVSLGAGVYWLILRRLQSRGRASAGRVIAWMVAGMAVVLLARLGLDLLSPGSVSAGHGIRWSLAWSGYFGIWLTGAVAFLPIGAIRKPAQEDSNDSETACSAYWRWIADSPELEEGDAPSDGRSG